MCSGLFKPDHHYGVAVVSRSKPLRDSDSEVEYQSNLMLKGEPPFVAQTAAHLEELAQIAAGRALLRSLRLSGKIVRVIATTHANETVPDSYSRAFAQGRRITWQTPAGRKRTIVGTGLGTRVTIKYNPAVSCIGCAGAWQTAPPALWLAHELIHAVDAAYGLMEPEIVGGVHNYERQAVGLPPYEEKEFTENRFRIQWSPQQPLRTSY